MRKILLLSLLAVFAFASCEEKKPQYQIDGKVVGDLNGKTVFLKELNEKGRPTADIDSAVITEGAFKLTGSVETPAMYSLTVGGQRVNIYMFVENTPIQVTLDVANPKDNKASSPLNDLYNTHNEGLAEIHNKMNELNNKAGELQGKGELTPEVLAELQAEFQKLNEESKDYELKFIDSNPNSLV